MAKPRRTFTREFKVGAVKLVTEQGRSFAEAAANLGIAESLIVTPLRGVRARNRARALGSRESLDPASALEYCIAGDRQAILRLLSPQ